MANDDWRALKLYCDQIDLEFFATVFSNSDVDLVTEMGCASIKIASQDTNFQDLIEYAAQQGRPIQLDTGGSSLGEIERAVDWVRNQGNEQGRPLDSGGRPAYSEARYSSFSGRLLLLRKAGRNHLSNS